MPRTSHRLDHFTESVIRRMTRVANEHGAINLSQGFPDFDPPEALLRAAERAARQGPHQYAVTWGAPNFRAALARKQSRYMGLPLDPDENFVVTCGSTEAMMVAMMTACNPGDKVIFSPFYENYVADAILSGAEPIYVPLHPPDFRFDPEEFRRAFERKPKALVLCNPANPSGKVFTRDELLSIARLAQEHDAYVLTDEVYEHIVYAPVNTCTSRRCQGCSTAPSHAVLSRRPTRSPAGGSASDRGSRHRRRGSEGARLPDVGAPAPLQEAAVTALEFPDSYYEVAGPLHRQARAIPRTSRCRGPRLHKAPWRLLRHGGHFGIRLGRRHRILRMAGA